MKRNLADFGADNIVHTMEVRPLPETVQATPDIPYYLAAPGNVNIDPATIPADVSIAMVPEIAPALEAVQTKTTNKLYIYAGAAFVAAILLYVFGRKGTPKLPNPRKKISRKRRTRAPRRHKTSAQSVIVRKPYAKNIREARALARKAGAYNFRKVDKTKNTWRFRQFTPKRVRGYFTVVSKKFKGVMFAMPKKVIRTKKGKRK